MTPENTSRHRKAHTHVYIQTHMHTHRNTRTCVTANTQGELHAYVPTYLHISHLPTPLPHMYTQTSHVSRWNSDIIQPSFACLQQNYSVSTRTNLSACMWVSSYVYAWQSLWAVYIHMYINTLTCYCVTAWSLVLVQPGRWRWCTHTHMQTHTRTHRNTRTCVTANTQGDFHARVPTYIHISHLPTPLPQIYTLTSHFHTHITHVHIYKQVFKAQRTQLVSIYKHVQRTGTASLITVREYKHSPEQCFCKIWWQTIDTIVIPCHK